MIQHDSFGSGGLRGAVRWTAAVAGLLAIVGGVPAVLAVLIGWPLPHAVPTMQSLQDSLTSALPALVVVKILACGAWLAWAHFTLCVLVELRAALTGRQLRVPLGGVTQEWAHRLVSSVLVAGAVVVGTGLTPAQALGMPANSPAATAQTPTAQTPTAQTPTAQTPTAQTPTGQAHLAQAVVIADQRPAGPDAAAAAGDSSLTGYTDLQDQPVYVVQPPHQGQTDNLWDIAERHLGAGTRWKEIFQLNHNRPQLDGRKLTDPDVLRAGWQLQLPPDAVNLPERSAVPIAATDTSADTYVVQPGQTLESIATERLGDPNRASELFALNQDRPQPDGQRLVDADLILPDWELELPPQAAPPAAAVTSERPAAPVPTSVSPLPTGPAIEVPQQAPAAAADQPDPEPASKPSDEPPAAPEVPRTAGDDAVTSVPDSAVDSVADVDDDAETAGEGVPVSALAFAGGGTLAGELLGALVAMRRQRIRERRLGAMIGETPPELAAMEKALLTGNAQAVVDVQFLHDALTSLLRTLDGAEVPDVVAVRLGAEVLELVQTTERRDAPKPWRVDETGLRWSINTDADLSAAGQAGPAELAPYPALVTVGHTEAGEHWLIDLERIGALSLTGDPERCVDLARYVAAELAHNRWSELVQVSVVGFGADLAELNPSRILYRPNVTVAVRDLRLALSENSEVLAESASTVLAGRARLDLPGDGWAPHVLLVAPGEADSGELPDLLEAMRTQRSRAAVAIVLAGADTHAAGTRWALHVDGNGRLSVPALDVELIAHRLPAAEAVKLGALLAQAAHAPNLSEVPARGDQPWDALSDAAGAPLRKLTKQGSADERTLKAARDPDHEQRERATSVLPLPASRYVAVTATTTADLEQLAPEIDPEVREKVEQADPDLDADLAAWHDPDSGIAKLSLLGPVSLVGAGQAPAKRAAFLTELAVYLAERPQGVTPAQLTADFWPTGEDTGTGRKMISQLRAWLGRDPRTGQLYVPMARDAGPFGSYRVQGLMTDGHLFRRLRLRGASRGPDGMGDLRAALELVRGVPLLELQAKGCGWLVDTPLHYEYIATIVEVAHVVATDHLAADEPAKAERAARVALQAGAPDDVPLLDLIVACDADGRHAEADSHVRQILVNNEVEMIEELQPRTYEVLRRRQYLPQEPARAEVGGR